MQLYSSRMAHEYMPSQEGRLCRPAPLQEHGGDTRSQTLNLEELDRADVYINSNGQGEAYPWREFYGLDNSTLTTVQYRDEILDPQSDTMLMLGFLLMYDNALTLSSIYTRTWGQYTVPF